MYVGRDNYQHQLIGRVVFNGIALVCSQQRIVVLLHLNHPSSSCAARAPASSGCSWRLLPVPRPQALAESSVCHDGSRPASTPGLLPRIASLHVHRHHRPSSAAPGTVLRISTCPRASLLVRLTLGPCTGAKVTAVVTAPAPRHSGTISVAVTPPAGTPLWSGCIILPIGTAARTSRRRVVAGACVRRHVLRWHLTAAMNAIVILGLCILNNLHALA